MVTIEQKLSLFSKLLQQDIKNENARQIEEIDALYAEKIKAFREEVDQKVANLEAQARKKVEKEVAERLSRTKMETKRHILSAKEKCVQKFLEQLKKRVEDFKTTPKYQDFLAEATQNCVAFKASNHMLNLILDENEMQETGAFLTASLKKIGIPEARLKVVPAKYYLLGGFIIEDEVEKTRMDFSIANLIDAYKERIAEEVLTAVEREVSGVR
jgi:V/A-type H+-transporting ATPase subunit E